MIPTNSSTKQTNMPIPKPPPAPSITSIVSTISTTPSRPMGRKNSSMYFQQPKRRRQSFSTSLNNDRNLFVSVEGNMMWDIGGLRPRTSSKRPRSSTFEGVPDFSLPEPATHDAVVGWKRKVGQYIVQDVELIGTTGNDNNGDGNSGGQLGHKRKKRMALGNSTKLPICGIEGQVVAFEETTAIAIEKMGFLSLDDENESGGKQGPDGGMSRSKD
ncbi:hypothetical protein DID88_009746 [Monilinia fructigena]|uniref:Uncharacterized protein n=1 Tax=Monilinia fructigena TaxID=38457 RepID=A0A395IJW6_9HELO|nr:hypothetical protein DID88_009746 [Monilinia fructigena]